jgi:hypothetical protein
MRQNVTGDLIGRRPVGRARRSRGAAVLPYEFPGSRLCNDVVGFYRRALTSQIGHCHLDIFSRCTVANNPGDNWTRLIPRIRGRAPESESFSITFSRNISFEGPRLSP